MPLLFPAANVFATTNLSSYYHNSSRINYEPSCPGINIYQPLVPTQYQGYLQPPMSWNPLNAPDNELRIYGYPPRPIDDHQYESWRKIVLDRFNHGPHFKYPGSFVTY